jgi:hypothetical protein
MAVPLLIITSSRSALSTWRCVSGKAYRSLSRPSLARRPVLSRMATPPTSHCLARQVSASHDKSPHRTTSRCLARQVRLRLVRGPRHTAWAWPPTHTGKRTSMSCGNDSWRPCRRPAPAGALNANLTCHTAITSPSTSVLPHTKLSPRHSNTLYDARGPRLRLTRGKTSENSGRLKQAQTTREAGQASRKEQFNLATRWPPRQDIATRCRYVQMDNDVRRDVPAASHCNSFVFPLCPPLETRKGRGGKRSQGLDFHTIIHHHPGLGNELPLPTSL